jgi:hypothetical protein
MRKQSLKQALKAIRAGKMQGVRCCGLDGCPVGGWPETQQAIRELAGELPHRSERSYTVHELISALFVIDHADRYRWRD